jgi:hypothetical protein
VWLIVLSDQLPIVALVSSYPTNQLIGHRPIPQRLTTLLPRFHPRKPMRSCRRFLAGIPHCGVGHPCVTHPSATPSRSEEHQGVRLACVRHAASVYPEPGSNSPSVVYRTTPRGVGSAQRCIELRSRPSCQICTWLFADSFLFGLCCQRPNLIDRNCCVRVRVHPVAVLLSTLQLSRYLNERLFRSFASTQVLLHSSDTLSRA